MAKNGLHRDPIITDLARRPQIQFFEVPTALHPVTSGLFLLVTRVFAAKDRRDTSLSKVIYIYNIEKYNQIIALKFRIIFDIFVAPQKNGR
jgi:hypothetical protein